MITESYLNIGTNPEFVGKSWGCLECHSQIKKWNFRNEEVIQNISTCLESIKYK